MFRFHLVRNLRSLLFVVVALMVMAGLGVVFWANRTGLPQVWREQIEKEIAKQGVYVKIGGLSYWPLRGVMASKVRVFSDVQYEHEVSSLEHVLLDFDKTKLARGIVHITKIELKNGKLTLPVDPEDVNSEKLEMEGANGTFFMPGDRRLEIRNASGMVEGIRVSLNSRLIGYREAGESGGDVDAAVKKRREVLSKILYELKQWNFPKEKPPEIKVFLEGDENDEKSLVAKVIMDLPMVEKNGYSLNGIEIEAEIAGDLVTVTSLSAKDKKGEINGRLDCDTGTKEGRFDLQCSLDVVHLMEAWFGVEPLQNVQVAGAQEIEAEGKFSLGEGKAFHLHTTGLMRGTGVTLQGIRIDKVRSAFAWKDGDLFLRDLLLERKDGTVKGKLLVQNKVLKMALESTFPVRLFKPLFAGKPLENVIADFTGRKGAEYFVSLEGGFDLNDPDTWAFVGKARVKNVNYRGVPTNFAECKLDLRHGVLDFTDGTAVFNYQAYPMRMAFDGPMQGTAKVGRIRYVAQRNAVDVENVGGTIWAAPLLRMFAPKIAEMLEAYRFHTPPDMKASGVVGVTPQCKTAIDVSFQSTGQADYRLLNSNVTLSEPSGRVMIRGDQVVVDDLRFRAFDGPFAARFDYKGNRLGADLSWKNVSMEALGSTYGFQMKSGGIVTGRLEFGITDGKVETMEGKGLFELDKAELFSVPIFGPLSMLISGVLNDKHAGYQRAKSAFCDFDIKNGILHTDDFRTSTTSLTFVGEGTVDLKELTLDMIMRMNARGLLGIITLPLKPFYGMFQFHGKGPLKDTKWESEMFTTPSKEKKKKPLEAIPKAQVVQEPE